MIELIQMLLSWNGILTLVVVLYVVDDVFRLGWKTKARRMFGREDIFNKDPELLLVEQELVRLEELIVELSKEIATGSNVPRKAKVERVSSPFVTHESGERAPIPVTVHNEKNGKSWQSWSDVERNKS